MLALQTRGLGKTFRVKRKETGLTGSFRSLWNPRWETKEAVRGIDLNVREGETVAFLGPNGAGKSTTIKMLTGILVPTSGKLVVNGYIPYKDREKFVQGIGVVFGQRSQLWWDIGVIESFRLLRKVYRVSETDFRRRLDELVETMQLQELLNRPVRKLSLGQRMRCELVAALLHNPSILFLDEPTIGLDIVVKTEIREFLKRLNREQGTTILLTTHDLQDIEALCSRVIMLDDGRIIYDGGLDELKSRWGKGREVQFQFTDPVTLQAVAAMTGELAVRWSLENDVTAKVWIPREMNVSEVLSRVVGQRDISDIKIFETNTDEIVREIYQSGSADAPRDLSALTDDLEATDQKEPVKVGSGSGAGQP